jgi:hypothetical protein
MIRVSQFLMAFGTFYGCSLPAQAAAPAPITATDSNDNDKGEEQLLVSQQQEQPLVGYIPLRHKISGTAWNIYRWKLLLAHT